MASARAMVPAQVPREMSSSPSGSCVLIEMFSARKPSRSDSPSATTPRMTGQRSQRWRLSTETSGKLAHLDVAARGLVAGHPAAARALLGARRAHGDGPRRDAAHHHALDHRLPAERRVARRGERR